MTFEVTPEEAQRPAMAMIDYFEAQGMTVMVEKPAWPNAPYRTTMVGKKAGLFVLVEAQGSLNYGRSLKELVSWLVKNRQYAEMYLATASEAIVQAGVLQEMKVDGVGLFVVSEDGAVTEQHRARNHALIITPDPTLAFGTWKKSIRQAVQKFNDTDRQDGLRDMCEIVERLTDEVGIAACRKGWLKTPEAILKTKDWAGQINELARNEVYHPAHSPVISPSLKDDLHSFRGSRNLIDHKVSSQREYNKRQQQFAERMMQGPRLAAELVSIMRKIK